MKGEMNKQVGMAGMDDKHVGVLGLNDNYEGLRFERKNEFERPTRQAKGLLLVR